MAARIRLLERNFIGGFCEIAFPASSERDGTLPMCPLCCASQLYFTGTQGELCKSFSHTTNGRKKTLSFSAVIYPDADGDWLVSHNPGTGTTTQGKTFEEALENLREATEVLFVGISTEAKGPGDFGDVRTDDISAEQQLGPTGKINISGRVRAAARPKLIP
jgi:predicted RNase H-like HicB family nuclease